MILRWMDRRAGFRESADNREKDTRSNGNVSTTKFRQFLYVICIALKVNSVPLVMITGYLVELTARYLEERSKTIIHPLNYVY